MGQWRCLRARGVGVSILRREDDGVVAGIGSREGPKLPTMAVTPGRLVADGRSRPTGAVAAGVGEICLSWSALTVR